MADKKQNEEQGNPFDTTIFGADQNDKNTEVHQKKENGSSINELLKGPKKQKLVRITFTTPEETEKKLKKIQNKNGFASRSALLTTLIDNVYKEIEDKQ